MTQSHQTAQIDRAGVDIDIDAAVARARTDCEQVGGRFTRIREHVYRALLQADQPVGAYDILATMDGVGAQKPPTVYRALDWLMERGLAQRIASLSKYMAATPEPKTGSSAYLLCRECGQAEQLDADPITRLLHQAASHTGFRSEETVIEVTGLCRDHRIADADVHSLKGQP